MLSALHEGYEYQDYFSVAIIIELILEQIDAEIVIDRKEFKGDKFDDLKVITSRGRTEYQIKYSDNERLHALTKDDFANGNGHDTALSDLFLSWRDNNNKGAEIKLCLAWSRPAEEDSIVELLSPIHDYSMPFKSVAYRFNGQLFWPEGERPKSTWRRFNSEIKNKNISRDEFLSFCSELTIFLEMPKASLDLENPGGLERVIIRMVEKMGVGIYPNNNHTVDSVINKLATEVKHARAIGNRLNTQSLISRIGLILNYGVFDQRFPVDLTHQVILKEETGRLLNSIRESSRVILTGNPGSGKSWLVDELIEQLKQNGDKIIHYSCFQSLQDNRNIDRIMITSLYGNLVAQIVKQFPGLVASKNTLFGADKAELDNLLTLIKEKFYLIVDGLDHVSREYELNRDVVTRSETEIISELLKINFPENCYVLISSQPIDELDQFKEKNFSVFCVDSWNLDQVRELMIKYQVEDVKLDEERDVRVSHFLLNKSQGNPLYLSYILRQIQEKEINKEIIEEIPDYDINLSKYYEYLYTRVQSRETVFALCGADFYLSQYDLMEITGIGEYVKQDISLLHPLLIDNTLCGGFAIYHESFRRFVLNLLANQKVNVDRKVYGQIIEWLKQKPFFEFDKAFYHLPELLYKVQRDDDNIALIQTDFVLNAVTNGYSREQARENLKYMIRSAGRARNIIALAASSELLAMLDDLNEFSSTGEEYFHAICALKGPAKLNQLMQIDGEPSFDRNTGLLACYVSSKAGVRPWWELYLDLNASKCDVDNLKYYVRYYLDDKGICVIPDIMHALERETNGIRNRYIEIAYNEIIDYIPFDEISSIAQEKKMTCWAEYLTYIHTGYFANIDTSEDAVRNNLNRIKEMKAVGEDDAEIIELFYSQIYHLTLQGNTGSVNELIRELEDINWFYNWVIYCIKLAVLSAQIKNMQPEMICESVLSIMDLLLQDTEVFKGKPRTCDLFSLQKELKKSYEQAVQLIIDNGTLEDIDQAFSILEKLDEKTGTRLDHFIGGPLPDSEFLELISCFLSVENYVVLEPYLLRIQENVENNEVYDSIAAAKLRYVSSIAKFNPAKAQEYYKLCAKYLVAYGFHKDIILDQILDSYSIFYKLAAEKPEEERDIITKMTVALLNHTDGRETNHFLNLWYEKLLETDAQYALSFLIGFQMEFGGSWITQHMIRAAIEKYCNDSLYSTIAIGLIESLPNDTSQRLIGAATKVFKTLYESYSKSAGEEALLIKSRMDELVVNIVSRFNILDKPYSLNESWKNSSISDFLIIVNQAGYDVSQYIEYFHIHTSESGQDVINPDQLDSIHDTVKTYFNASTMQEAKIWLEKNEIRERDIANIGGFLKKYQDDKSSLLEILSIIIKKAGGWNYSKHRKNLLEQIINRIDLSKKDLAQIHMLVYLSSYEWGSSLIDQNEFLKSLELDSETAYNTFFQELPEVIIARSGRITKGLINALFAANNNVESLLAIWRDALSIMKLRFPNLGKYSIDYAREEVEKFEGFRDCLLMRFVDGGKEQFLSVYAYLADRAEEGDSTEFVEAMIFCLKYFKRFNLVTQLAIAHLVSRYGFQLSGSYQKRLNLAIDSIYPTGNLLLDVIFSQFTTYKITLTKSFDKHVPDYMEQEDVEFYLAEKLYDLGEEKQISIPDSYSKNSIYSDYIMNYLNYLKMDYTNLYIKLHSSTNLNNAIREFVAGSMNIPEMNTVYKSYVIQYALHAIIEKAYKNRMPEIIPQSLFQLVPDFQGMYRSFKSRVMAPKIHLYEVKDTQRPLPEGDAEYTRIGCFEIRRYLDYRKSKYVYAYSGIVSDSLDKDAFPVLRKMVWSFEKRIKNFKNEDSIILLELDSSLDKELEDNHYLWPSDSVIKLLDLQTEYDSINRRYVASSQAKEVVFYMNNWRSCYMGDSEYPGYAIPLYEGTALYIKKSYLQILKERYKNLYIKNKVERIEQPY